MARLLNFVASGPLVLPRGNRTCQKLSTWTPSKSKLPATPPAPSKHEHHHLSEPSTGAIMVNPPDACLAVFIRLLEQECGNQPPPPGHYHPGRSRCPSPRAEQKQDPTPSPGTQLGHDPDAPAASRLDWYGLESIETEAYQLTSHQIRSCSRYVELGLEVTNLDWYVSPNVNGLAGSRDARNLGETSSIGPGWQGI